jgi:Mn2+/Fe2+ NRAMP family transporter
LLGPGLVTDAAGDHPSVGTNLLPGWRTIRLGLLRTVFLTMPIKAAIQIVSARTGGVTGKGSPPM